MSGGNLSWVYHFYTMAVTTATMVLIYIYHFLYLSFPSLHLLYFLLKSLLCDSLIDLNPVLTTVQISIL